MKSVFVEQPPAEPEGLLAKIQKFWGIFLALFLSKEGFYGVETQSKTVEEVLF